MGIKLCSIKVKNPTMGWADVPAEMEKLMKNVSSSSNQGSYIRRPPDDYRRKYKSSEAKPICEVLEQWKKTTDQAKDEAKKAEEEAKRYKQVILFQQEQMV